MYGMAVTVKSHSPAFSGRFSISVPLSSAVPGFTEVVSDVDDPSGLVVNLNLLPTVPTALVGSVDDDLVNQLVQHFRCQFFRVGVLADTFQELLEIVDFLFAIVNQRLQFPNGGDLPSHCFAVFSKWRSCPFSAALSRSIHGGGPIQTVIQLLRAKKKPARQNRPQQNFRSAESDLIYWPCISQAPKGMCDMCDSVGPLALYGCIVYL